MFRRLTHCPRCNTRSEACYPEMVHQPQETTPQYPVGESGTPEPATYEAEEWYRYEPCGCVIPPEEQDELTDQN